MKILSFGAGMQSTALALMSCENVDAERKGHERTYPLVPVYDLVVFCDLGFEPRGSCNRPSSYTEPVTPPAFDMRCWTHRCIGI